jgi:acyl-CoA thioester hydrolase
MSYKQAVDIRWADLDPNFHVRHSVYYDWGAQMRLAFLYQHGITPERMALDGFGLVLFREEARFKREIRAQDTIEIDLELYQAREDLSRWSIRHTLFRGETICAIIQVDGAWIDTRLRKLAPAPALAIQAFEAAPRSLDFSWI